MICGSLAMVRGGITVEDNAMLAANVQLISNHHDVYGLRALPFSPVRVGRHAVVGADSVVTKNCRITLRRQAIPTELSEFGWGEI